jgi:hypothetical protein
MTSDYSRWIRLVELRIQYNQKENDEIELFFVSVDDTQILCLLEKVSITIIVVNRLCPSA